MSVKKLYFISRPSPTPGRSPLHGVGGGLFGHYKVDGYISALKKYFDLADLDWVILDDDTEADIEKLISQNATLLVCAPSLRFQFFSNGFDKNRINHLSTMDYALNNINPVVNKIKEICNEK
ncbi:nitrogen fixation protein NifS [Cedecea colo]|uniref:Nitrogen fixation protein NifS n=1 Tax=Cedecea colo TaxID=2552946 RepID=A0ABX0VR78_9ENTR|nr:nitrogen fixation protein NifS [Cedecea colo]NIY49261.1 nitrogen fixation protein NifS [Cedecea colo]